MKACLSSMQSTNTVVTPGQHDTSFNTLATAPVSTTSNPEFSSDPLSGVIFPTSSTMHEELTLLTSSSVLN